MESKKLADEVIIHGNHAKKTAVYYELPIIINRTIKFIGKYGIPVIMAKNGSLFTAVSSENQTTEVIFINITFQGRSYKDIHNDRKVFIVLHNSSFHMKRCSFVSVPRPFHLRCNAICNFTINDSKIVFPIIGLFIEGNGQIFVNIARTNFIGKQELSEQALMHQDLFPGTLTDIFELNLSVCKFTNFKTAVLVFTAANICRISIKYSTFQNNSLNDAFDSSSRSSSVSVISPLGSEINTKLSFIAHSCYFLNNYANEGSGIALRLYCKEIYGDIANCTFKDNHARMTGGAVSYYKGRGEVSRLLIHGSIFENNSAGNFSLLGTFLFYSRTYGSGGALSFAAQRNMIDGFISVSSCTFTTNSAPIIGGTIYAFLVYIILENVKIITPRSSPVSMTDGTVISMAGHGTLIGGNQSQL